jgi:hypothetical protein
LVHVFKTESDFQLPSAVLKNATPSFRGKPARPLEYVHQAKLTERIPHPGAEGLTAPPKLFGSFGAGMDASSPGKGGDGSHTPN